MDVSLNHTDDNCRCCLKNDNLISIFEETIEDIEIFRMLIEIVPVQISRSDGKCRKDPTKIKNFN